MMHGFRNPKVWTLALIAGMVTVTVSAQQPPAQPAAAPQQTAVVDKYVVGQATPEPQPGTQMMNLTLEQAMQMALDKNLDLKVARMNPPGGKPERIKLPGKACGGQEVRACFPHERREISPSRRGVTGSLGLRETRKRNVRKQARVGGGE